MSRHSQSDTWSYLHRQMLWTPDLNCTISEHLIPFSSSVEGKKRPAQSLNEFRDVYTAA